MGKSRRQRAKDGHRKDPIAKPVKPPTDPELAALREKSILPVIKDLQSSDPKSRTAAAAAVSNLVQDPKCRKLFLREQIVHIVLTQTLTDATFESRAAGWDILRLLAEEEEADFCIHLFRQDVLSAIEFGSKSVLEKLATNTTSKSELKFIWTIVESQVALLTALAEAQDEVLEAIVDVPAITLLLFTLISSKETPSSICLDALSCLLTLSEDNERLADRIVKDHGPKPFSALLALQTSQGARGVLACGVLHNICSTLDWHDGSNSKNNVTDASLIPTLSSALETITAESDLPLSNQWSNPAEVIQLSLEILASIGTDLLEALKGGTKLVAPSNGVEDETAMEQDDEDKGSDEEIEEEEDDEMDQDEMEADMDMVTGADDDTEDGSSIEYLPTLQALVQQAIPRVIRLTNPSSQSEDAARLQSYAVSTLNNIAWSVSCIDFSKGQDASLLKGWTPAGKAIWEKTIVPILAANTADVELATKVTSLAWAVSRTLGGNAPLKGDEHQKFMALYQATKGMTQDATNGKDAQAQETDDPFQGLGVKCIGVLGQLALNQNAVELNRAIGVFLLTTLNSVPETPVADAVEALNQIFDIYADEEYAYDKEVFWKDNFLQHLVGLQPKIRAMVKTVDKRSMPELRTRTEEAILNLGQFIKYKTKHKQ